MGSRRGSHLIVPIAEPSAVERWARSLPFVTDRIAVPQQIHSVSIGRAVNGGAYHDVDGLMAMSDGIVLGVRTADCVPLLLSDRHGSRRVLVHAGREGLLSGIVEEAVRAVMDSEDFPEFIDVWIGPHIGSCCYRFPHSHPIATDIRHRAVSRIRLHDGKILFDPGSEAVSRILALGFGEGHIRHDGRCTSCWHGGLPSHRREGMKRNRSLLTVSIVRQPKGEDTEMAVDPDLLKILVCPETKEPVSLASEEIVSRLNELISHGTVKNRGGEAVKEPMDAGLVREDGKYLYPIRDDIPIMLIEEAIELPPLGIG